MKKRLWIPLIGWIICYGFFNNCVIAPLFSLPVVEWEYLLTGLGIMLGLSGARDIGLIRKGKQHVDTDHNALE